MIFVIGGYDMTPSFDWLQVRPEIKIIVVGHSKMFGKVLSSSSYSVHLLAPAKSKNKNHVESVLDYNIPW